MKIILTCGHPYSGHQAVAELLQHCGVAEALPSRNNQYSPAALQSKIFEVYEWNAENSTQPLPEPGKVWQELGGDLFMGNLSQPLWGWGDHQTVWLMDFWKAFDPQIRFLLVYSAPEFLVCNMLQQQVDAPEDMDVILNGWHRYNTELLRFYNRHQDRCLLVNAQTALQQPQALVEKLTEAFSLSLKPPDETATAMSTSRVAAGLACSLIHSTSPTEQNALYQEIESTADIISSGIKPSTQERLKAWSEYNRLISELKTTAARSHEYQQTITTLRDQQSTLEQQRNHTLAKQQDLEQENELLLLQLHQVQEELEQQFLGKQQLQTKEQQLTTDIKNRQQEIDKLKANNTQLDSSIKAKQQEIDKLKASAAEPKPNPAAVQELEQENELLLLQLHQVQEELERYFLEYQKLNAAPVAPHQSKDYELIGITLDLRKASFAGDNWYYAEHDGRWSGPGLISTVELPVLGEGHYEIVLDIVDAMKPNILEEMKATLNGKPLEIHFPIVAPAWKRRFKKARRYPKQLRLKFTTQDIRNSTTAWQLQLTFPQVISPSACGINPEDLRKLGIRLRSVTLKKCSDSV